MSTLHERLAELAEGAAPTQPRPATDLWRQGRSRQRRSRAGAVLVVAAAAVVLAILGVASLPQLQRTQQAPAGTDGRALPDRLYQPSPWLAGTGDAGPLGPLAVVSYAERKSLLGTTQGALFGVSAASGAYRFLDLPGLAVHSVPSLSPDGRHLAYWTTGAAARTTLQVDDGIAVYDTTTGAVRTYRMDSDYGLGQEGLVWAGDSTLVIQYAHSRRPTTDGAGESSGPRKAPLVWELDAPVPVPRPALDRFDVVYGSSGHVLAVGSGTGLALADGDTGQVERRFPQIPSFVEPLAPSPDLEKLALLRNGGTPTTILTTDRSRVVPGPVRSSSILGWRDDSHVVVVALGRPTDVESSIVSLDVDTGGSTILTRLGPDSSSVLVASDLLGHSTVHATRPSAPLDRRVSAGLAAGIVVAATAALVVGWRRRVRS